MPLARIITHTREDALPLANRLEAHGYKVEIVGRDEPSHDAAELEIELDKMGAHQALAQAARLSRGKQVSVVIAPGCLDEPQAETEEASVAEQLLDAVQSANFAGSEEAVPRQRERQEKRAPWTTELRASVHEMADDLATHYRAVLADLRPVLKRVRLGSVSALQIIKEASVVRWTRLQQRWNAYREARGVALQRREEAKIQQMRHAELERARHLLEQQEETRREAIHRRMAEEERAKQRLIQEQLRRVREAEEEEQRQMQREAQLERQRQEAVRLAHERERVARERVERERLAEEARRIRAEEAERRRREREEQIFLQRSEAQKLADNREQHVVEDADQKEPQPPTAEPEPVAPVNATQTPVEPTPVYALAEPMPPSRFDSDLNSPYHPGWTWAAAAAGAATVGIMLLWTAVSASRSTVRFTPLSPSSLLPARASEIQQQVPFGPVKVVVHKTGVPAPAAVVPAAALRATTPVTTAPVAIAAKPPTSTPKPSAAKSQMASSASSDSADNGPEVVTRHFALPSKAPVPQAGQTATVKRYSDMN